MYDFIAIGDMVTDAFVRLEEALVSDGQLCMKFPGKIPFKETYIIPAVGNSANAAVAAARLGLKSALVSNIGGDYWGKECLSALKKEGVSAKFVKVNKRKKTNYHYVLWYGDERTILIRHEHFNYSLPNIGGSGWVYFSSVGENSSIVKFHKILENYLKKHPNIKLAFQPGTYQIKMGREKLAGIYKRSEVFFCNKQEAERILDARGADIKDLLRGVSELGPKIAVITDGVLGAYVYDSEKMWKMPIYPDIKPPYERTGAGDSFSSTFTVALALGKSVSEALRWAPINSMSVVQEVGAQAGLLSRRKLEGFLKKAPKNYEPRVI